MPLGTRVSESLSLLPWRCGSTQEVPEALWSVGGISSFVCESKVASSLQRGLPRGTVCPLVFSLLPIQTMAQGDECVGATGWAWERGFESVPRRAAGPRNLGSLVWVDLSNYSQTDLFPSFLPLL